MSDYLCPHEPVHATHLHWDDEDDDISWDEYDCNPECDIPEEDWMIF